MYHTLDSNGPAHDLPGRAPPLLLDAVAEHGHEEEAAAHATPPTHPHRTNPHLRLAKPPRPRPRAEHPALSRPCTALTSSHGGSTAA